MWYFFELILLFAVSVLFVAYAIVRERRLRELQSALEREQYKSSALLNHRELLERTVEKCVQDENLPALQATFRHYLYHRIPFAE